VTSFVTEAERKIEAKARHYSNRARGVVAGAKSALREGERRGGDQSF
jgi:hypothetical protein